MPEALPLADMTLSVGSRAIAVAVVANVACALVGVLLVIRRQSLMGDAISHAVLPGLAVAFLLSGSLSSLPMLLGAVGAGLATTFLTETLRRRGGVSADAALGIVYTSLFALGVVLVKSYLKGVHFDVACVYEGSLLHAAIDTLVIGGAELPRALFPSGLVLLVVAGCYALLWKELKLCAFDPALATTMGISSTAVHYLVMALVAMTAAVAFQAVGAILVVAMMITPAAIAQLFTDRLKTMVLLSAAIAASCAVLGYRIAELWDVSPAGSMAALSGVMYLAAALFSPRYGALAKVLSGLKLSLRIRRDDLLASLYRDEEKRLGDRPHPATDLMGLLAQQIMLRRGQAYWRPRAGLCLTDSGRQAAIKLVRSHRLWEAYLVEEVGLAEDHVHEAAHVVEHYLDPAMRKQIEQSLGGVSRDPHGRDIPADEPEKTGGLAPGQAAGDPENEGHEPPKNP